MTFYFPLEFFLRLTIFRRKIKSHTHVLSTVIQNHKQVIQSLRLKKSSSAFQQSQHQQKKENARCNCLQRASLF